MSPYRVLFVVAGLCALGSGVAIQTSSALTAPTTASEPSNEAAPEYGPDYGVNETIFPLLWSENVDDGNLTTADFGSNVSSEAEFASRLAASTDIAFSHPPEAVGAWHAGDFDFSPGDSDESIYPEGASLEQGAYIRDAYVEVYAIQPSTIRHGDDGAVQYVAPDGEVLVISDYRVRGHEDTTGETRESGEVLDHRIESVDLLVDGETESSGDGHQETLPFQDLSGAVELTVEVEIATRVSVEREICTDWNVTQASCNGSWDIEQDVVDRSKTVTTSREVVVEDLDRTAGERLRFEAESDQRGAVVTTGPTWSRLVVDDDVRVRSNWWFFTAGKTDWHTLVSSTETETKQSDSDLRPLTVHAYPDRETPDVDADHVDGEPQLVIEEGWGQEGSGTTLPRFIDIEPAVQFVDTDSIAVSSTVLGAGAFDEVTVQGIVPGNSRIVGLVDGGVVTETDLELTVVEVNATRTVVHASVEESGTGEAVSSGEIVIGEQAAPVNESGMAVIELDSARSLVDGRYEPEDWWRADTAYEPAEDRAKAPPNLPEFEPLVQLVLVTLLWFLPLGAVVYGFDYASGGAFLGLTDEQ